MLNSSKTGNMTFDFLTGQGFDVHALQLLDHDHFIMLCGIKVPCRFQLIAHSDGDVALHALVDALLGAIGAGDIGEHFPPTDLQWQHANSSQFVLHALQLCHEKNAVVVNVDITVITEHPKISPHKSAMKEKLVQLLNLNPD